MSKNITLYGVFDKGHVRFYLNEGAAHDSGDSVFYRTVDVSEDLDITTLTQVYQAICKSTGSKSPWFSSKEAARSFLVKEGLQEEAISVRTAPLSHQANAPMSWPAEVYFRRDSEGKLLTDVALNPDTKGTRYLTRCFPDKGWEGADVGPALVNLVYSRDRYAFLSGEMIRYDTVTSEDLRDYIIYNVNPDSVLTLVDSPIRGKYCACKPWNAWDQTRLHRISRAGKDEPITAVPCGPEVVFDIENYPSQTVTATAWVSSTTFGYPAYLSSLTSGKTLPDIEERWKSFGAEVWSICEPPSDAPYICAKAHDLKAICWHRNDRLGLEVCTYDPLCCMAMAYLTGSERNMVDSYIQRSIQQLQNKIAAMIKKGRLSLDI